MPSTAQLTATPKDASANILVNRVITYSSDNTSVATVNGTGLVSAVAVGTCNITVACEGKTAVVPTTVVNANSVAAVVVTPSSATVAIGGTLQLNAVAQDSSGNPLSVSIGWSSSNASLATVDATGLVTGVAQGSVTITAAAGAIQGTSTITIPSATTTRQMWFSADTLTLTDGQLVSSWLDSVSGTITATQSVNANRPIYRASSIGGLPAVDFEAACDLHFTGLDAAAFTRFFVINPGTVTPGQMDLIKSPMTEIFITAAGSLRLVINKTGGQVVEWKTADGAIPLNVTGGEIIEVAYDASNLANNPVFKLNGTALTATLFGGAQSGTRVSDAGTTFLGSSSTSGGSPMLGPMSEYVKVADALDHSDERHRLGTKYGITVI